MLINSKWGKSYLIQLAVSFPLQLFTLSSVFPGLCKKHGQSWVITPSFTTTSLFPSQWHLSQLSGFKTSEWNKKNLKGKKNKWFIVKWPCSLENSFCTLLFEKSGQTSHLCLKQRSHPCWMFLFILEVGLSPSFSRNYIHTNELNAPGLTTWLEGQMVWHGVCPQSQDHSRLPAQDGLTHTACS